MNMAPWLLIFALFIIFRKRLVAFLIRRQLRGNPAIERTRTLEFGADRVRYFDEFSDATTQWPAYVCFTETTELFILSSGRSTGLPIPKRAFTSPEQIDAFRALLASKLPAA